MGDLDDAEFQAREALAMAHSSHCLPFVADAHLALAEIASARITLDGAAHPTTVVQEAQPALDDAQRYGLAPLAAKARQLLSAHRPRRAAALTEREEQIVGLLAAGLSNRSIASRLQLSERTVENHVSHALTKTGHSSRTGLAAWYRDLGRS
jgi:DNA-binding NarL/FixJ family response regulator